MKTKDIKVGEKYYVKLRYLQFPPTVAIVTSIDQPYSPHNFRATALVHVEVPAAHEDGWTRKYQLSPGAIIAPWSVERDAVFQKELADQEAEKAKRQRENREKARAETAHQVQLVGPIATALGIEITVSENGYDYSYSFPPNSEVFTHYDGTLTVEGSALERLSTICADYLNQIKEEK